MEVVLLCYSSLQALPAFLTCDTAKPKSFLYLDPCIPQLGDELQSGSKQVFLWCSHQHLGLSCSKFLPRSLKGQTWDIHGTD